MNYAYQYFKLICKRIEQPLMKDDCYVEKHHIIPKSEGGSNDAWNLVNLTAREHYVAHLLLAKIYDDYKMLSAIQFMQCKRQGRYFKFNSHLYAKLRKRWAENPKMKEILRQNGVRTAAKIFRHDSEWQSKVGVIGGLIGGKINAAKHFTHDYQSRMGKRGGKSHLGKHWWNNGIISKFAFECPDGFTEGRLKMKRKHKSHE